MKKVWIFIIGILSGMLAIFFLKKRTGSSTPPPHEEDINEIEEIREEILDDITEIDEKIEEKEKLISELENEPVLVRKVEDVNDARNILLDE